MLHFCFCPHFSWAELKDLRLFLCTQNAYFSQILFTNLSKSVLVNEIIHPPHRCGISRCWLDSMIIAQVCLRLATIKGHSKMCSFTVLGGGSPGWSENQSVSGVTTICQYESFFCPIKCLRKANKWKCWFKNTKSVYSLFYFIINKVINISLRMLLLFIIIKFGPPMF